MWTLFEKMSGLGLRTIGIQHLAWLSGERNWWSPVGGAPDWPEDYYGRNLPPAAVAAIDDEFAKVRRYWMCSVGATGFGCKYVDRSWVT